MEWVCSRTRMVRVLVQLDDERERAKMMAQMREARVKREGEKKKREEEEEEAHLTSGGLGHYIRRHQGNSGTRLGYRQSDATIMNNKPSHNQLKHERRPLQRCQPVCYTRQERSYPSQPHSVSELI